MTETPPPEEWLLTTAAIPYWTIALVLLIAVVIFAIFNVQAGKPTSNLSNIQKRFGLITWSRRAAHFIIGLWGCALALLMGAFFLTAFQLLQEILATANQDVIRQLDIALPAVAAASAGLIALPITLNRLQLTNRQTQAEEEGLITDRINAAVLGLGAEKTAKVTEDGQVIERTEPNIEVRIGAILALERIAKNNLDVHVQIMELLCAYIRENANIPRKNKSILSSFRDLMSVKFGHKKNTELNKITKMQPQNITESGQDIQMAINVLGRRPEHAIKEEQRANFTSDLSDCFFAFISFRGDFDNAKFQDTFMVASTFEKTKLSGTIFRWCNFHEMFFDRISANGALIRRTHIAKSRFTGFCEAKRAWFDETYFTANTFSEVDISDSYFTKCRYQSTELPYIVHKNTIFEECSIVRRTTER